MAVKQYSNTLGTFYEANAYLGIDPETGKEKRAHKKGFKTAKEAKKWVEFVRVHGFKPQKASKMKFNELAEAWLLEYKYQVRESTYHQTSRIIHMHLLPFFDNKVVEKITRKDCQALINKWSIEFVSFKSMVHYAKKILNYAEEQGIVSENPFKYTKMPKIEKPPRAKKEYLTKEELAKLLNVCEKDERKIMLPLFRTFAYTGLRRGEVLALTWDDLDLENKILYVNKALTTDRDGNVIVGQTKNKASNQDLALDAGTVEILKKWRTEQAEDFFKRGYGRAKYVFSTNGRTHINIQQPSHWLSAMCKRAGIEHISPHKLRHTHCTLLIDSGVPIKDVQRRMRHSDINTTLSVYAHAVGEQHDIAEFFDSIVTKTVTKAK